MPSPALAGVGMRGLRRDDGSLTLPLRVVSAWHAICRYASAYVGCSVGMDSASIDSGTLRAPAK